MKNLLIISLISVISASTYAREHYDFWPRIPFNIVGANLCEFRSAYSQTRSEYISEMVQHAETLLYAGDIDPAQTLLQFNLLYERNLSYARRGLGITLERSFKAYLDQYYRNLRPRQRKLTFKYVEPINQVINRAIRGSQRPQISADETELIDLFAFGSYSMSPDCRGNVIANMTIINRDGYTKEYMGKGRPSVVMSQIASQVFEDYQRTQFPTTLRMGNKTLTLLGGPNGDIDRTSYLPEAKQICQTLGGRLPTGFEYKMINNYGSWSGGVTLGRKIWAMNYPNVFIPYFERSPVRSFSQVNDKEYYYICVK